jgi:hypothetical protein
MRIFVYNVMNFATVGLSMWHISIEMDGVGKILKKASVRSVFLLRVHSHSSGPYNSTHPVA